VQPGSHLLKTSQSQDALAFVTADGHRVIVVYNSLEQDCEKTIQVDGKTIRIRLKAKSVNTLLV
jgi:glucosylceramidase